MIPDGPEPKVTWFEKVWLALPLALLVVGGAIGGACGGAAWAINQQVFKKTENPVLRYVWTGLISIASILAYVLLAALFLSTFK